MFAPEFEFLFDQRVAGCRELLIEKAKQYASDADRLHNFQVAAALNSQTPEQACWSFLTKHLVSLSDMIWQGHEYPQEVWDEKIGDSLNYLFLLNAIVSETHKSHRRLM